VDQVTDDELMLMFRQGDVEAFDVLFDRHYRSVYNYARSLLGDCHGAEDMLQETFLTVARAGARYEPRGHFRTWLMRICRNGCLNLLQRERLRRGAVVTSDPELAAVASDQPSPPEVVQEEERMPRLRLAVARLPERQREAIALYAFEQMGYREISEVLEAPLGTVKTLIHRARSALAQELERIEGAAR